MGVVVAVGVKVVVVVVGVAVVVVVVPVVWEVAVVVEAKCSLQAAIARPKK